MAIGIFIADNISVPWGALYVLMLSALLMFVALCLSRRGMVALVSLCLFFVLIGYLRAFLPDFPIIPSSLLSWSANLSQSLLHSLDGLGLSPDASSLLKAMLLGSRTDLSPELQELYRQTGAAHVLALSGLHLTILLGLFNYCLVRLLAFRWRYVFGTLGILLMGIYVLLTGFPISLCRASLMMSLLILGQMRLTGHSSWHTLGLTAFLLLLFSPLSLYDVGFQLSFAAVCGLLLFYRLLADIWLPQHLIPRRLWQIFLTSVSAQLGVMPLLLHYFHRFSVSGILLSPIYILLATAIMYSALLQCFLTFFGLGFIVRPLVEMLVGVQHGLMSFAAQLPFGGVGEATCPWQSVVLCYAALFFMIPPLRAIRKPDIPQHLLRWALFFRSWPYVLAAIICLVAAYVLR